MVETENTVPEEQLIQNLSASEGVFSITQLQTLLAVADNKTYKAAADDLGVTETAVKGRMFTLRKTWRRAQLTNTSFLNLTRKYPALKKVLESDRR